MTPLGEILLSAITKNGPLTLAQFMEQALNHPEHGYYQTRKEKIGKSGDFITAPEISQVFGELIGVWCVYLWTMMGKPSAFQLVELGPGNGSLIANLLSATSQFSDFSSSLRSVLLVEGSPYLQERQKKAIEDMIDNPSDIPPLSWSSTFPPPKEEALQQIPTILIAQEFFDALPIHQFLFAARVKPYEENSSSDNDTSSCLAANTNPMSTSETKITYENVWSELLVDVNDHAQSPLQFSSFPSLETTPALIQADRRGILRLEGGDDNDDGGEEEYKVGDQAEMLSEEGYRIFNGILDHLDACGGSLLVFDYGNPFSEAFKSRDTLRGFSKHKQVHPLSKPGEVDVTADVDFQALVKHTKQRIEKGGETALRNRGMFDVLGVVSQSQFLGQMGIMERLNMLLENPHITQVQGENIISSVRTLVDVDEMGERFRVMGIVRWADEGMKQKYAGAVPGFIPSTSQQ